MATIEPDDVLAVIKTNHPNATIDTLRLHFPSGNSEENYHAFIRIINELEENGDVKRNNGKIEITDKGRERVKLRSEYKTTLYKKGQLELNILKDYPKTRRIAYISLGISIILIVIEVIKLFIKSITN